MNRIPHINLEQVQEKSRSFLTDNTNNYDFSSPKIFCIGLSKTATTSLHVALKELGCNSAHWVNPKTKDILDIADVFVFDALSDTPISYRFEELYYTFPNSKFIYTVRNVEDWVSSAIKHFRMSKPSQLRYRFQKKDSKINLHHQVLLENLYAQHESWEDAYKTFDKRVRHFFQNKEDNKLLTLDICAGEGWDKLCPFLGFEQPLRPFPQRNNTKKRKKINLQQKSIKES